MTEPLQKAVQNATTGEIQMVDLTPEEMAEVEARVSAAQAAQLAAAEEALADQAALDAFPSDEDIRSAKSINELSRHLLKMGAAFRVLNKRSSGQG